MTSVPGWATLSYHANGLVNQIVHSNGITDTQASDPNSMKRPASISSAKGATTLWSTGTYAYDGTGNVVKTGNGYFLYDRVSRLIEGRVYDGATGGTQKWQGYAYDPFGNITSIGGTSGRSTPTSAATNRLNGTGTLYDAAGNLTAWNNNNYQYDAFNQMKRMTSGSEDWLYIYTAGDERFWSYRVGGGGSLWALRDLDGRLLREYEAHTSWATFKDYIYRGAQLVGSVHSTQGTRHFHVDHLGTPRLITSGSSGGDFYTVSPCRVLDTRTQSAPLSAGETRTVTLAGVCGIPSSATAVSVNLTVVDATTDGEMTAWPSNEPKPTASAISYQVGANRANNGMQKLGNGALSFYANQPTGTAHLVIDVNGYYTEDAGTVLAYHVYYPFGEEATAFNQDTEQMKFTGHERDLASVAGVGDDLDYMHARHCSPVTGRFLSVDPALESADPFDPQSWNRYNYVRNNPLAYIDPTGELLVFAGSRADLENMRKLVNGSLHGYELVISNNGTAQLVANNAQGPASSEQAALAGVLAAAINRSEVVRIGVEAGAPDVLNGDYASERIDIQDIGTIGSGPGVSGAAVFAHEVAEQTARQVFNLQNNLSDYGVAHAFGIAAQDAVSGFTRGTTLRMLPGSPPYTGKTVTQQARGSRLITVVMFWDNGNLTRVLRQEP